MKTNIDANVELVYFPGCPNVDDARANLRSAFAQLGRDPEWREWNLEDSDTPGRVRGFASPAILIRGQHIFGDRPMPEGALACSALGAPPAGAIMAAMTLG
ncbi:MAG: hypothetical protein ACE5FJ_00120 [Gemmatimonadales bacterium]